MGTCFVIQPFDGNQYDKRFDQVFAPAIKDTGLEPYRVDRGPSATILIEQIEKRIQAACVCLADITENNPNVWFELGYAIAAQKDVIMVRSDERKTSFPFDIRHRSIITYKTQAPDDFDKLKKAITTKIQSIQKKQAMLEHVSSNTNIPPVNGLNQLEIVTLTAIAQNLDSPDSFAPGYQVRHDMEKSGYTKIAVTLGLDSLIKNNTICCNEYHDAEDQDYYKGYTIEPAGFDWLRHNKNLLKLKRDLPQPDAFI